MMETWVVNLENERHRWDTIREHLSGWGITDPYRFNAIPPNPDEMPVWKGLVRTNVPKKMAIARTYLSLAQNLEQRDADRFLVIQDDVRFTADPHREFTRPMHLYGGYRIRGRGMEIWFEPHIHPWAFTIARDFVPALRSALTNPDRQVCELWCRLIRPEDVTYDNPATAEAT